LSASAAPHFPKGLSLSIFLSNFGNSFSGELINFFENLFPGEFQLPYTFLSSFEFKFSGFGIKKFRDVFRFIKGSDCISEYFFELFLISTGKLLPVLT